jgi:hypothetical protein
MTRMFRSLQSDGTQRRTIKSIIQSQEFRGLDGNLGIRVMGELEDGCDEAREKATARLSIHARF